MNSMVYKSFVDELMKIKEASAVEEAAEAVAKKAPGFGQRLLHGAAERFSHPLDLAGLGILAVPSVDEAQAHLRAGMAGEYDKEGIKQREVLPHWAHPVSELAGLGVLAAPVAAQAALGKH